jgi:hypothetical protein
MSDNDFIRRKDVLDELSRWHIERPGLGEEIAASIRDMPAANHAETAHLDSAKERQLRNEVDAAEDEILELKAKLETAAPFCSPGFIDKNWRKANILQDPAAKLGGERSRFARITDPKGIDLIEAGLKLLREKA